MENFVRIIPKQGCEQWPVKLGHMGAMFFEAEYGMVKQGFRAAAVIHMDQHNMGELLARINKDKLVFTPLRTSGYYQGFAHRHKEVKLGDPFYWYGCLTKTWEDGQKFKKADTEGDHRTIGWLLGYPDCCTRYFTRVFPLNYDPIWVGREGKLTGYPECNQMLRYFSARITSYLSCSPTCAATRKIGHVWLKVMSGINKCLTDDLVGLLSAEIIWSSYHGVVQVETPYFVGITHTFPIAAKPRIIKWGVKMEKAKPQKGWKFKRAGSKSCS